MSVGEVGNFSLLPLKSIYEGKRSTGRFLYYQGTKLSFSRVFFITSSAIAEIVFGLSKMAMISHGLRARSKHLQLLLVLPRKQFGPSPSNCYSHLSPLSRRFQHLHHPILTNVGPHASSSIETPFFLTSASHFQVAVSVASRQFSSRGFSSAGEPEAPVTKGNSLLLIGGGTIAILLTALGVLEYKEGFSLERSVKKSAELGPQFQEKAVVEFPKVNNTSEDKAHLDTSHENQDLSTAFDKNQEQLNGSDGNQEELGAFHEHLEPIEEQGTLESMKESDSGSLYDLHSEKKELGGVQTSEERQQVVEAKLATKEASIPGMSYEDANAADVLISRGSKNFSEGGNAAHSTEIYVQDVARNPEAHLLLDKNEKSLPQEAEVSHAPTEVSESNTSTMEPYHKEGDGLSEISLLQKGHEENVNRFLESHKQETSSAAPLSESFKNMEVGEDAARSSKDHKPVIDIVAAIHAAEQRQAEIDALAYAQQLEDVEHRYQCNIEDLQTKMRILSERSKGLEQDFEAEKVKNDSKLRMLQELSETKLQNELKLQEDATKLKLEEAKLVAQVEALATFIEENVALLKELGDIKLQVEALRAAFDARSEEAQQSYNVHKLALGTLSLEDAMLRGVPLQKEIAIALETAGALEIDLLVQAAVMSLPSDVIKDGSRTPAELQEQFLRMRRLLSELALIPIDGGGVLTHAFAWLASFLKVSENGSKVRNGGFESVLGQVALLLAEGKLAEAADALERGSIGTKAQKLASEWAKGVRDRLVMEQACSVLRANSIATSLSFL